MNEENLRHFVCPSCHSDLVLESVTQRADNRIRDGQLACSNCRRVYPIRGFIPRFTQTDANTEAFGFEWNRHPNTQFDSVNGMRLTEERFYRQTNWPRDLSGHTILEVGCGAGRFTEIALQTGAQVFSVDASHAIDVNWAHHGKHQNLLLCQASLYDLPFRQSYFDRVFCFGVLQHTPDVARAFAAISRYAKSGGELAVDAYNRRYWRNYHTPMYLIRPVTKRMSHDTLYNCVSWAVPRLLPISTWLRDHIPIVGRYISGMVPIANYNGQFPTQAADLLEQYSILDTFDTLSPKHISPQTPDTICEWFAQAGYEQVEADNDTVCTVRGRRAAGTRTTRLSPRSEEALAI